MIKRNKKGKAASSLLFQNVSAADTKLKIIIGIMLISFFVIGVTVQAEEDSNRAVSDAFDHEIKSNGRIEYDYDNDGDLSGKNDVVLDAEDIKALEKKSEVTLYGNFVPDKDSYGDNTGTGTLYIRIGENP